ncbi:hypothetical protein L1987_50015 [Smallanthus sonchifolius]|uniref:Uncharacterized protein n=1 Tax=Smallanthus sonchifolius TaxID=185202 RepID=A0ACB9FW32_9ASTR|nr:hypothetical protein L1987_50015 [Smallanthus sonchifolius]
MFLQLSCAWWGKIAASLRSFIDSDPSQYMDSLNLSYNHLPPHLRPCFLYFGAFPEDYEVSVTKLIWLWIAHEFIHETGTRMLEDVAKDFLMDLIKRILVMTPTMKDDGGVKTFRIHDLLRSFCLRKAEEEDFLSNNYRYEHLGKVLQEGGTILIDTYKFLRILDAGSVTISSFPSDIPANLIPSMSSIFQNALSRTPNLRKLGFCGPLISTLGDLEFSNLGSLVHLEKLKLFNTFTYHEATRSCNPIMFPEKLKKLTLSNTGMDWEEMWTFSLLPNLEVLKLKLNAWIGERWETGDAEFGQLKVLVLQDLGIRQWISSKDNFPRLQHLLVCKTHLYPTWSWGDFDIEGD